MFSPPPHCTASLAGEMRAPSLSQSQACRRPGGSGGSSGHWRGSLGGHITSSLWHHSFPPCTALCASCHQGLKAEPGSELHSPFGEPQRGGGQTEGCAASCRGAAPTQTGFVHQQRQDFCLQMGLFQNGKGEKDVNQSSTAELSCFMCWRNRLPSGWQVDVLVSVPVLQIHILS